MRLADAAVPVFARHETFHPRYGWFRKSYEVASENSDAFTDPNATVELGVGKNMVKAIRFWGTAAKLIEDDQASPNRRASGMIPTPFGRMLFDSETGWDPYMEDPGTLWLLHWRLLSPPCRVPVWWIAFNEFHAVEFDADELELASLSGVDAVAEWSRPHPSTVRKDVTALVRTYAPTERSSRTSIDDILDCPLRELGLITRSQATGRYRFTLGTKPTLPSAVVAHAVLDYISSIDPGANTALLSRLAGEPGSPGRAFRLSEAELADALLPAVEFLSDGGLSLASPAGTAQLAWDRDPSELALTMLDRYFLADFDTAMTQMGAVPVGPGAPW